MLSGVSPCATDQRISPLLRSMAVMRAYGGFASGRPRTLSPPPPSPAGAALAGAGPWGVGAPPAPRPRPGGIGRRTGIARRAGDVVHVGSLAIRFHQSE